MKLQRFVQPQPNQHQTTQQNQPQPQNNPKNDNQPIPFQIQFFRLYNQQLYRQLKSKHELKKSQAFQLQQLKHQNHQLNQNVQNMKTNQQNLRQNLQSEKKMFYETEFRWNDKYTKATFIVCLVIFVLRFWLTSAAFYEKWPEVPAVPEGDMKQCAIHKLHNESIIDLIDWRDRTVYLLGDDIATRGKEGRASKYRDLTTSEGVERQHEDTENYERINRSLTVDKRINQNQGIRNDRLENRSQKKIGEINYDVQVQK